MMFGTAQRMRPLGQGPQQQMQPMAQQSQQPQPSLWGMPQATTPDMAYGNTLATQYAGQLANQNMPGTNPFYQPPVMTPGGGGTGAPIQAPVAHMPPPHNPAQFGGFGGQMFPMIQQFRSAMQDFRAGDLQQRPRLAQFLPMFQAGGLFSGH